MKVKVKEFLVDLRDGMGDSDLMNKYGLSAGVLTTVFSRLIEMGVIDESVVHSRSLAEADSAELEQIRQLPRNYVVFQIPIYDASNLVTSGWVRDVTEVGLQIEGIESHVGATRSLLIRADEFVDVFPFQFEADCRWVRAGATGADSVAGYRISNISPGSLHELRKLILLITLGDLHSE